MQKYAPVIVLFVFITALVFIFKSFLLANGFDTRFLVVANAILCVLSLSGFYIQLRGLKSTNINAFIRGVYSSLLLKMVIIMIAIIAYIFTAGGANKPALFTSMGFYIIYTSVEVSLLMKTARNKRNV